MMAGPGHVRVHYREARDGIEITQVTLGADDDERQTVIYPVASYMSVQEILRLHELGVELVKQS